MSAIADGEAVPPATIDAFADAVLGDPALRLALEVREGGPHALRRAIELAALVLTPEASADDNCNAHGRAG